MIDKIGDSWAKAISVSPDTFTLVHTRFFFLRLLNSPMIKTILKMIGYKRYLKILEAGCGSGKLSLALAIKGNRVYLGDISNNVGISVRKNINMVKSHYPYIEAQFIKHSILDIGLKDNTFDLVFNEGVLEHWFNRTDRIAVLKEMKRVTKRGGIVMIIVPNGSHPLMNFWRRKKYPGFNEMVPQMDYSPSMLYEEIAETGLKNIIIDGIDPFNSISLWPTNLFLRGVSFLLKHTIPTPKSIRLKYGVYLICVGVKYDE